MGADITNGIVHAETYWHCSLTRNSDAGRNENRNGKRVGDHEGVHPLAQKWRHSGPLGVRPSSHAPKATDPRPLMKGF